MINEKLQKQKKSIMNIIEKIKFPQNQIIFEKLVQTPGGNYVILSGSEIYSGMTGRLLGKVVNHWDITNGFGSNELKAKTMGRNFTIDDKRYYIAETDDLGRVLDSGVLLVDNGQNAFRVLNDFLMEQEMEYQKSLPALHRKLYLLKNQTKAKFSKLSGINFSLVLRLKINNTIQRLKNGLLKLKNK